MDASNVGERNIAIVGHPHLLLHLGRIHYIHLDQVPGADQKAFLLRQARHRKCAKKEEAADQIYVYAYRSLPESESCL